MPSVFLGAQIPEGCRAEGVRGLDDHVIQRVSDSISKSFERGIKSKVCNNSSMGEMGLRPVRLSMAPSISRLAAFFPLDLMKS